MLRKLLLAGVSSSSTFTTVVIKLGTRSKMAATVEVGRGGGGQVRLHDSQLWPMSWIKLPKSNNAGIKGSRPRLAVFLALRAAAAAFI